MTVLHYDEAGLVGALGRVSAQLRAAFAAACAERLLPAYVAFSARTGRGDPAALAEILERIWKDVLGDKRDVKEVRAELARCMALIPGGNDERWVDEQAYADDAASAVAYTLRTLESGEPQEAAWAARRAYEALDHHVMHRLGIEGEDQILRHPLVQAELSRQRRDLDALLGVARDTDRSTQVIAELRGRAKAEAAQVFAGTADPSPRAG